MSDTNKPDDPKKKEKELVITVYKPTDPLTGGSTDLKKGGLPPKSGIYTRAGDTGKTTLYDGSKVDKNSDTIVANGKIDSLNAQIGLCICYIEECRASYVGSGKRLSPSGLKNNELTYALTLKELTDYLQDDLLHTLMRIASHVATPLSAGSNKVSQVAFDSKKIDKLEELINKIDYKLPKLTNFVLPVGTKASIQMHVCRTFCREAELALVPLNNRNDIDADAYKFVNRLSSFMFVTARYLNYVFGETEIIHK